MRPLGAPDEGKSGTAGPKSEAVDARVKLVVAIAGLIAVIASHRPHLPIAISLLALTVAWRSSVPLGGLARRLIVPVLLAVLLVAVSSVFTTGSPAWNVELGDLAFSVTWEGLHRGLLLARRVIGSACVLLALTTVTPPHEIFRSLGWLGLPRIWVETALLSYRHVFTLREAASSVAVAQRTRLGYVGFRRSLSSAGTLTGLVIIRAIDQAIRTDEAMRLRGHPAITTPLAPPLTRSDLLLLLAGTVLPIAALFFLEVGRWV